MNIAHLKAKILDLAVRGKLTEQRPEEGSAEELLERIREEKQRLIAEGKLKQEKPLPEITEDEIPFNIPAGWKWCRCMDLFTHSSGKALKQSDTDGIEREYITTSNIYWNRFDLTKVRTMYFKDSELEKCTAKKGDLLLCNGGDVGRAAIWNYDYDICIQNHVSRLRPINPQIQIKYFFYLLWYYKVSGFISGKGIGISSLTVNDILSLTIPLPPLAEQKRIVEKIEAIFEQADIIEEKRLALKTAVRHTKSRVLDLAVRGKLTEQRPEEGSAEELLERIREEKQRLIAEGKLKKAKPLPEITEEEIPFDIPAGWKWVRLPELCTKPITDGTHNSPPQQPKGDFLYITAKNIKEKGIDLSNVSYVTQEIHDLIYSRCNPEKNDVLLTKDGTIGVATVNNLDYPFSLLSSVALIKPVSQLLPWYLTYVLRSSYLQTLMHTDSKGSALRRIILEQINSFIIPLPPLAEQKRIVEKIEQIFTALDTIGKAVE